MPKFYFLALILMLFSACSTSKKFTGYDYDPPDVTLTTDKAIEYQKKRTIGAGTPKVWISNEFAAARMNDFYAINDSTFEVLIRPERAPINNSAWYGFKIWSDEARKITLRMRYEDGAHRYEPKIFYADGASSDRILNVEYEYPISVKKDADGVAYFNLYLEEKPLIVSSQMPYSSKNFEEALNSPVFKDNTTITVVGSSHENRPIYEIEIDETEKGSPAGVLIIVSRQHPPEVTGFLTSMYFLNGILSGDDVAREFRKHFVVKAYPMVNPDGSDYGHWRNNAAGNDLNRDWEHFNQPETRAVHDALMPLLDTPNRRVYYGLDFHSTSANIFYPIDSNVKRFPDNFTQRWQEEVIKTNSDITYLVEEFPTDSPIAKNWIYKTFGADAVTYEVSDTMSVEQMEAGTYNAVKLLMEMLLEEFYKENPDLK